MKRILPKEKYDDIEYIFDFMQMHPIIGDEELSGENNFHCFWKGPLLQSHLVSLKSILHTQKKPKIYLWTPDYLELISSGIQVPKEVQIMVTSNVIFSSHPEWYDSFMDLLRYHDPRYQSYNHQVAYASDIFRFFVLKHYGGVWFDLDVVFLKDMNDIRLRRFVYKWGIQSYGNGAVMRLEKGNDILENVLRLGISKPFYPTTTFVNQNNLDMWMLPTEFFDIIWKYKKYNGSKVKLPFKDFPQFFEPIHKDIDLHFLPGCFAYHWHNQWDKEMKEGSPIKQLYDVFR